MSGNIKQNFRKVMDLSNVDQRHWDWSWASYSLSRSLYPRGGFILWTRSKNERAPAGIGSLVNMQHSYLRIKSDASNLTV